MIYGMTSPPDAAFLQRPSAGVISQRLRLVYPFRIGREQLGRARELLTGGGMWTAGELNEEYRKEMLEGASDFVFGALRDGKPEHYYCHEASFRTTNERDARKSPGASYRGFLNGDHGIKWLVNPLGKAEDGKVKDRARPRSEKFWVDRKHGAELFLNPFGSGVLSIALVRELPEEPSWADLLGFVYHLSHIKRRSPLI